MKRQLLQILGCNNFASPAVCLTLCSSLDPLWATKALIYGGDISRGTISFCTSTPCQAYEKLCACACLAATADDDDEAEGVGQEEDEEDEEDEEHEELQSKRLSQQQQQHRRTRAVQMMQMRREAVHWMQLHSLGRRSLQASGAKCEKCQVSLA